MTTYTFCGRLDTLSTNDNLVTMLLTHNIYNRPNYSHEFIQNLIPEKKGYNVPYKLSSDEPGVYGKVIFNICNNKELWVGVINDMLGKDVKIVAYLRKYKFKSSGNFVMGTKLIINWIELIIS